MPNVKHMRGTRAGFDALVADDALIPYQLYVITDEGGRIIMATGTDTYAESALRSELATEQPKLIVSRDGGDTGGFGNFGQDFTTIPLDTVELDNVGGWNAATFEYRIPKTGLWDCSAKFRLFDNAGARSHGLGIDTQNRDSPSFVWSTFPGENIQVNRFVLQNRRVAFFNEGQYLRTFAWVQFGGQQANRAALTAIYLG